MNDAMAAMTKAAEVLAEQFKDVEKLKDEDLLDYILDHGLFAGWDTEDEDLFDERFDNVVALTLLKWKAIRNN